MSKNRIWLGLIIIVTIILYLAMAFWLYYQDKVDTTGWGSIGIVAFALTMVFPIYSAIIGTVGQITLKRVWLAPVINSIGVAIFVLTLMVFMQGVKPIVLIIIPAVFIVTIAISFITMLIQKTFIKKNPADSLTVDEGSSIDEKIRP